VILCFPVLHVDNCADHYTGIVNEPPPPPPPVVTPTSGAENSVNYTSPNLTPETVRH
jgi:hypothetical protein